MRGGIVKSKSTLVKDPAPGKYAKTSWDQCILQAMFWLFFHDDYASLDVRQVVRKIEEDVGQEEYHDSLSEWEQNRRDGKRTRSASSKKTAVKAETQNSLTARTLLGYLWPKPALQKHKLEHLWNKQQKQSILHCNKTVVGILRDVSAVAAIEANVPFETA